MNGRRVRELLRRHAPWIAPLLFFAAAGVLEAVHAFIGYSLSGRPQVGYTLHGQPLTFVAILARTMPSWLMLGIISGIALRLTRNRPILSADWKASVAFHLPAALLFSGAFMVSAAVFRHFLFVGPEAGLPFGATLVRYYMLYFNTYFLFYLGIAGVYSAFLYYRDLRERELVAERLRRGLTEARLRALQNQLQPHFLFNTLNAMSGLALGGDTQGTVRMLRLLGDLLRATLERGDEVVRVTEELELLDLYLQIQQVRFEDRLDVRLRVDPEVLDAEIPTFLLQPLVENAVRHGIARSSAGGWIEVRVERVRDRVRVTVTDSGPGLPAEPPAPGVGLGNCIARLEQLYGADHAVLLQNAAGGGTRAIVEWPLRNSTDRRAEPTAGVAGEAEMTAPVHG